MATKTYLDKTGLTHYDELIKAEIAKKQNIIQLATLPTLTADYAGETFVQYVGETTEDYTQGDFYKADLTELEWVKQTYNKTEVDSLMTTSGGFVVAKKALPTTDIQENKIYLYYPGTVNVTAYKDDTKTIVTDKTVWWYRMPVSGANQLGYVFMPTGTESDSDGRYYAAVGNRRHTVEEIESIETAIAAGTFTAETIPLVYPLVDLNNNTDIYDEYVYVENASGVKQWEKIGSTSWNMSEYVKFTDLTAITTAEIDALFE